MLKSHLMIHKTSPNKVQMVIYMYCDSDCIPPMSPDYGNVTISEDRLVALFTCLEGFTLNGVSQRQCLTDGSGWTNTNPSCCKYYYIPIFNSI